MGKKGKKWIKGIGGAAIGAAAGTLIATAEVILAPVYIVGSGITGGIDGARIAQGRETLHEEVKRKIKKH